MQSKSVSVSITTERFLLSLWLHISYIHLHSVKIIDFFSHILVFCLKVARQLMVNTTKQNNKKTHLWNVAFWKTGRNCTDICSVNAHSQNFSEWFRFEVTWLSPLPCGRMQNSESPACTLLLPITPEEANTYVFYGVSSSVNDSPKSNDGFSKWVWGCVNGPIVKLSHLTKQA